MIIYVNKRITNAVEWFNIIYLLSYQRLEKDISYVIEHKVIERYLKLP